MSNLINPHTQQPMKSKRITDEELMKILQAYSMRLEFLNTQNMQLGLYVEFLLEHLMTQLLDENGNPILQIDGSKFPEFAKTRMEEIEKDLAAHRAEAEKAAANDVLKTAENLGINLDE